MSLIFFATKSFDTTSAIGQDNLLTRIVVKPENMDGIFELAHANIGAYSVPKSWTIT